MHCRMPIAPVPKVTRPYNARTRKYVGNERHCDPRHDRCQVVVIIQRAIGSRIGSEKRFLANFLVWLITFYPSERNRSRRGGAWLNRMNESVLYLL